MDKWIEELMHDQDRWDEQRSKTSSCRLRTESIALHEVRIALHVQSPTFGRDERGCSQPVSQKHMKYLLTQRLAKLCDSNLDL